MKIEIRDPHFLKILDYLKSRIKTQDDYLKLFGIPTYLINENVMKKQKAHFFEYFFCMLNSMLKSLSRYNTKSMFLCKFFRICEYLDLANKEFMEENGFHFSLKLILEKYIAEIEFKKKLIINIPLQKKIKINPKMSFVVSKSSKSLLQGEDDFETLSPSDIDKSIKFSLVSSSKKNAKVTVSDERKQLAGLFYSLLNNSKKGTTFSLRLSLEQIQVSHAVKKEPMPLLKPQRASSLLPSLRSSFFKEHSPAPRNRRSKSFSRKVQFSKKFIFNKNSRKNSDSVEENHDESEVENESDASRRSFFKLYGSKNRIIQLKDKFKEKITNQETHHDHERPQIEQLKIEFVDNKKRISTIVGQNYAVKFLSEYIYQHFVVEKSFNYLPGIITLLLIIQIVSRALNHV